MGRNTLRMSPSLDFPLLLIKQHRDGEYVSFQALAEGVSIISADVFNAQVDVSHANMIVNFDMPKDSDEYLCRAGSGQPGATVMSFPMPDEMEVIFQLEHRFGMKFRNVGGIVEVKMTENRESLKRRLAASGSRRQRLL